MFINISDLLYSCVQCCTAVYSLVCALIYDLWPLDPREGATTMQGTGQLGVIQFNIKGQSTHSYVKKDHNIHIDSFAINFPHVLLILVLKYK